VFFFFFFFVFNESKKFSYFGRTTQDYFVHFEKGVTF